MSKPRINTIEDRQAWMRERQHPKIEPKMATEVERLLTVQEAAPLWGQSEKATRNHFKKIDGVRLMPDHGYRYDHKLKRYIRQYDQFRIPLSLLKCEIEKSTVRN